MTEEVDRRHGVNGNSSSKTVTEDAPVNDSSLNATGGRLKFFKGGFLLLHSCFWSYHMLQAAVVSA